MPVLRLIEPLAAFEASYRSYVRELMDRGEPMVPFSLMLPHHHFGALLANLAAAARGEGLPGGFVPHSSYWLVRHDLEIVGISNLRHHLTESLRVEGGHIGYSVRPSARGHGLATELLRATLERARARGIVTALITCMRSNLASARVIMKNGGRLVSEEYIPAHDGVIQRYEIAVSSASPPA
jgi:predicted acetyltransferase